MKREREKAKREFNYITDFFIIEVIQGKTL